MVGGVTAGGVEKERLDKFRKGGPPDVEVGSEMAFGGLRFFWIGSGCLRCLGGAWRTEQDFEK